jgi:hypothetical protein
VSGEKGHREGLEFVMEKRKSLGYGQLYCLQQNNRNSMSSAGER